MSEEHSKYLDALRTIKRLELEISKLKHKNLEYEISIKQRAQELEDARARISLQDQSLISMHSSLKSASKKDITDSSVSWILIELIQLIFKNYSSFSEQEKEKYIRQFKLGNLAQKVLVPFIKNPVSLSYKQLSSQESLSNFDLDLVKEVMQEYIERGVFEQTTDGLVVPAYIKISPMINLFQYKDYSNDSLEAIFEDISQKITSSKDPRFFKIWIDRLHQEIIRRKLPQTSNEINRLMISLGGKTRSQIHQELNRLVKIAENDKSIQSFLPPKPVPLSEKYRVTSERTSPPIDFLEKPLPPRPIPRIPVTKPASDTPTMKAHPIFSKPKSSSTFHTPAMNQASKPKAPVELQPIPVPEKVETTPFEIEEEFNKMEMFQTARNEIRKCGSSHQAVIILSTLRTALEEIISGKLLYEINQYIRRLQTEEEFDHQELISQFESWVLETL
ncbi:MAG: hypothetical protein ACXAC7_17230 [Candidatus Hodarchaeales archaeon]|jgi:hypothetical protein